MDYKVFIQGNLSAYCAEQLSQDAEVSTHEHAVCETENNISSGDPILFVTLKSMTVKVFASATVRPSLVVRNSKIDRVFKEEYSRRFTDINAIATGNSRGSDMTKDHSSEYWKVQGK